MCQEVQMQNFFGGFCGGGGVVFKKFGVAGWVLTITRQEKNSKTPAPKQKWGRVGNRKPASYLPCIHSYLVSDSSDSTTKTSVVHVVLSIVATWHMVSPHQRPSSFIQPKKKKKKCCTHSKVLEIELSHLKTSCNNNCCT